MIRNRHRARHLAGLAMAGFRRQIQDRQILDKAADAGCTPWWPTEPVQAHQPVRRPQPRWPGGRPHRDPRRSTTSCAWLLVTWADSPVRVVDIFDLLWSNHYFLSP
jgi:hypothetical protein